MVRLLKPYGSSTIGRRRLLVTRQSITFSQLAKTERSIPLHRRKVGVRRGGLCGRLQASKTCDSTISGTTRSPNSLNLRRVREQLCRLRVMYPDRCLSTTLTSGWMPNAKQWKRCHKWVKSVVTSQTTSQTRYRRPYLNLKTQEKVGR